MKSSTADFIDIIKLAGAYIAFCIGSGYATGQEIMQFFTAFGFKSLLSCGVSLVLFTWIGYTLMKNGRKLQFKSDTTTFKYYCGNFIGNIISWVFSMFVFSCFVVMLAGAGASLNQYYGLNIYVGSGIMALLAIITVVMGLNKLVDIIGVIGPVIIILSLAVSLISIFRNFDNIFIAEEIISTIDMPKAVNNWLLSGILYGGFMSILLLPFLIQLSQTARNSKTAILGGTSGGFVLVFALIVMNMALLSNIGNVYDKSIPSLVLASDISPLLGNIYTIVIILGIYSSAVPMLWMVCNRFAQEKTKKYNILSIVLVIIAFILSGLPFTTLVGIVYPYSGYIGIIIMALILLRQFLPGDVEKYKKMDSEEIKEQEIKDKQPKTA